MTMVEFDDTPDSDCTDSDDSPFEDILPSNILDDFEPLVTVPRPPCDACETSHHDGRHTVVLGDAEYEVCESCLDHLTDEVERFHWWDRLTEDHYDRAAEYLRSLDEVWCVKDHAYPGGEMWVHTPFCHASVVGDVCDHFGFHIYSFQIVQPGEPGEFDCLEDHGPCVEINLDYNNHGRDPFPLEYDIFDTKVSDTEWLDEDDRLFDDEDA